MSDDELDMRIRLRQEWGESTDGSEFDEWLLDRYVKQAEHLDNVVRLLRLALRKMPLDAPIRGEALRYLRDNCLHTGPLRNRP